MEKNVLTTSDSTPKTLAILAIATEATVGLVCPPFAHYLHGLCFKK